MLTDYHLHLRPDEEDTPPERYFTAENVDRYLEAAAAAGIEELGVSEHIHRFTQALEIWRHPWWQDQARDDVDAYCEFVRGTPLRLGIEADFVPGRPRPHRHFPRGATSTTWSARSTSSATTRSTTRARTSGTRRRPRRGLAALLRGARRVRPLAASSTSSPTPTWSRSGAAPGRCPERDPRHYYEPAVEAIAESGIAVELSTAGLRKPVGELYPARAFAEMCVEAGAAFALSSDAHLPEQVGFGYDRAVEFLARARGRARSGSSRAASAAWSRSAPDRRESLTMGVGIGYDSHRFAEGRRLVLGGVEIEHERGLAGHSDADVLTHAVIDAVLGAAGLGDIGTLFPDDDERWRDADSIDLLRPRSARSPAGSSTSTRP